MSIVLRLFVSLVLLAPSLVLAATLETPGNGDNLSGIGVIRGWKCEAVGEITVVIDGGSPISMAYGNERPDVRNFGSCSSAHVGFVSIWNYGELDSGEHTAVAYDNGVEFARSIFGSLDGFLSDDGTGGGSWIHIYGCAGSWSVQRREDS